MRSTEMQSKIQNLKSKISLKVCGLTQLSQIEELIALKVDFLGFIFYENSPRYVLPHLTIKEISDINHKGKVGVFVNDHVDLVTEIAHKAKLNFVQLHGDEDEEYVKTLSQKLKNQVKIIKVFRIGNRIKISEFSGFETADYFLFETDSKAFGGTGKTFDWKLLQEAEIPKPYFLSGGLSLDNINQVNSLSPQPFALDINSRFETSPGNKDLEKIKQLLT